MSAYILCQTKRTDKPFYIENISTSIYSLEELCYYIHTNLYLVDETLINEKLCKWIDHELSLPALAAKIRSHLGKYSDVEDVLYPLFREINYLSYEEIKALSLRLEKMGREDHMTHQKKKADALVKNGMYVNAVRVYQDILRESEEPGMEEEASAVKKRKQIRQGTLHNLGCAYAHFFQMDKALECFFGAYEESKSREELVTYLLAFHGTKTPIEYESRLNELSCDDSVRDEVQEKLDAFSGIPGREVSSQEADSLLLGLTAEYHKNTGS